MTNFFCNYEQSFAAKELGFDEPCLGHYFIDDIKKELRILKNDHNWTNTFHAPLKQQLFKFFRDKYNLDHEIPYAGKQGEYHAFVQNYVYGNNGYSPSVFSYEEAEDACIEKLIEIAKKR